jgi:hypothetical protein
MDVNIAYDLISLRTYQKSQNQVAFPLDTFRAPEQCLVLHFEHEPLHMKVQALGEKVGDPPNRCGGECWAVGVYKTNSASSFKFHLR